MEQELKPQAGFGSRGSWRDEARYLLGDTLGEGLLGKSEQEKYLEFLQQKFGSELPRDLEGNITVPESRPLGQSFSDPSDFGAIDKILLPLSAGSSVAPRLALGAGTTEMGMLLADAQGEYEKGNTTGAGIMAALAGLPIALAARGKNKNLFEYGKDAVSGLGSFIRSMSPGGQRTSMVTPEGFDMPFYETRGEGIAGLLDNQRLNVTPTKFKRVLTDKDSLDSGDNIIDRQNVETLLERSILNNPVQHIDKKYAIKEFLDQTKSNLSKSAHTGFDEQIRQFVSPETLAGRFTIQELLDDIGKNKPSITEQVEATTPLGYDYNSRNYSAYMPMIPKHTYPTHLAEASKTIAPTKYIESNFSIHSPKLGKMWEDPGHKEVGTGALSDDVGSPYFGIRNTENRIFTARTGIYDIEGEKVLIPAESQSGIYGLAEKTDELNLGRGEYSLSRLNDILRLGTRKTLEELGDNIKPFLRPETHIDDVSKTLDAFNREYIVSRDANIAKHRLPEDFKQQAQAIQRNKDLVDLKYAYRDPLIKTRESIRAQNAYSFIDDMTLAHEDLSEKYARKLAALTVADPTTQAPLLKDWFPLRMKGALNLASEEGVDRVRFPINDYALAQQRGEGLSPAQTRIFSDSTDTLPSDEATEMAIKYKNFTEKGIKRIEAEYGVDLNAKFFEDDNYNEFYDIEMTPELKKAFEKLVYKDGGLVQKPLMPLKYNY